MRLSSFRGCLRASNADFAPLATIVEGRQDDASAAVPAKIKAELVWPRIARISAALTDISRRLYRPLPEYLVDAFQPNILFLDLLRRRGNQ
jgi:hypothetical protein